MQNDVFGAHTDNESACASAVWLGIRCPLSEWLNTSEYNGG